MSGPEASREDGYRDFVRREVESLAEGLTRVLFGDYSVTLSTSRADPLFGNLAMVGNVVINSARNALAEQVRLAAAERERAAELAVERDRLQALLEAIDDGVVVFDDEERVRASSTSFRRIAGIEDDIDGMRCDRLEALFAGAQPEPADALRAAFDPANGGRRLSMQVTLRAPMRREVQVLCFPVGGESRRHHGRAVILRDVTAHVDAGRFREDLIGNAAHDLRTPLTSLLGFLELLVEGGLGPVAEAQRPALVGALRNATRMKAMLEGLLDLERIRHGRLRRDAVDLVQLAQRVAQSHGDGAAAKGLRLEVEAAVCPPVVSDPTMLEQILTNLVGNAVKFTSAGKVVVRVGAGEQGPFFEVEDTGVGIPVAMRDQLLRRFFRGEQAAAATPGWGVGLSIVRQFAELLQARLELWSEPEVGSTFRVTLPSGGVA